MRKFILLLLMVMAGSVAAQDPNYSLAVIPTSPTAGQAFQVQVSLRALSCYLLPDTANIAQLPGNVVQFELDVRDACFPFPDQQRIYNSPPLPAGLYTFRIATCVHFTPPLPNETCYPVAQQSVTVVAAPIGFSGVPALSWWGFVMLASSLAIIGLGAIRRA